MRAAIQCPDGWQPACSCSITADTPRETCWQHGWGTSGVCPHCGQFRADAKPCKRCGCHFGLRTARAA